MNDAYLIFASDRRRGRFLSTIKIGDDKMKTLLSLLAALMFSFGAAGAAHAQEDDWFETDYEPGVQNREFGYDGGLYAEDDGAWLDDDEWGDHGYYGDDDERWYAENPNNDGWFDEENDELGWNENEGWGDEGAYGYYEDEGVFEDNDWAQDEYGYYDRINEFETNDSWFDGWANDVAAEVDSWFE